MRVFISWSGDRSKIVANALREWLPDIIQSVKPWVSGIDIQAGARWSREVEEQLKETQFGIICLTKENQTAPWLLFEAGALAKSITGAHVCPYLIDLTAAEIAAGPLTLFQAKHANKDETRDILLALNDAAPETETLPKEQLLRTFERWWPDLQRTLESLPPPAVAVSKRAPSDVMDELLTMTRQLGRQMTETVYLLSRRTNEKEATTEPVHHVRLTGESSSIEQLLNDIRGGVFGGRVVQQQRYSANIAAVNLRADGTLRISELMKRASELGVDTDIMFVNM